MNMQQERVKPEPRSMRILQDLHNPVLEKCSQGAFVAPGSVFPQERTWLVWYALDFLMEQQSKSQKVPDQGSGDQERLKEDLFPKNSVNLLRL
jgi:hypothetical protein